MNTYYPIHILVAVPCPPSIRDRFSTQFGSQCHFTFINSSQTIPESLLRHTDVIIGEPDEPDLLKAPRLKWLQLTWAGADKYARMKRLPSHLTITNASGAFGIIISEYVIGTIIALYRSFSVQLFFNIVNPVCDHIVTNGLGCTDAQFPETIVFYLFPEKIFTLLNGTQVILQHLCSRGLDQFSVFIKKKAAAVFFLQKLDMLGDCRLGNM